MLNRFAHALLVLTSLAPIALVHGVTFLPEKPGPALQWGSVAGGLLVVCLLVLRFAGQKCERVEVSIPEAKNVDKEVLAFLVSYALPLVVPARSLDNSPAFWTFMALVAVVLYQAELVHVNPLLGLLGYRFYEVQRGTETVLLIARSRSAKGSTRTIIRLSDTLWLETPP